MATVTKRRIEYPKGSGKITEKWVVRYTDQSGTRRLKTFTHKKLADQYRLKVETEIERGDHTAVRASATVEVVAAAFMQNCRQRYRDREISQNHYKFTEFVVTEYIVPVIGQKLFSTLTVADVDYWRDQVFAGDRLESTTRNKYFSVLKLLEDFANTRDYTKRHIIRDSKAPRRQPEKVKTFKTDEIATLLATVEIRAPRQNRRNHLLLKCAVHLAAFCGLRRGEIFGLTMPMVDMERRLIMVRHSLDRYDTLRQPKTRAGRRNVPMPMHVRDLLAEWIATQYRPGPRELLFEQPAAGRQWAGIMLHIAGDHWYRLLQRAGLETEGGKHFHFHALRHYASSWWIANGLPLPDVATMLGHSKFDMTLQTYAHSIVGDSAHANRIDELSASLMAHVGATNPPLSRPNLLISK